MAHLAAHLAYRPATSAQQADCRRLLERVRTCRDLSLGQREVLVRVILFTRGGERPCTVGTRGLARAAGLSERHVRRCVHEFEARGLVAIDRVGGSIHGRYLLRLGPAIEQVGRPSRPPLTCVGSDILAHRVGHPGPPSPFGGGKQKTTTNGPSPSSSSASPGEGEPAPRIAQEAPPAEPDPEAVRALAVRLVAVLGLVMAFAARKAREWALAFGLERVELAITLAEHRRASRHPLRGEGGIAWVLNRWRALDLEAIRLEVDGYRPRPKAPPPAPARPTEPSDPVTALVDELVGDPARREEFEAAAIAHASDADRRELDRLDGRHRVGIVAFERASLLARLRWEEASRRLGREEVRGGEPASEEGTRIHTPEGGAHPG